MQNNEEVKPMNEVSKDFVAHGREDGAESLRPKINEETSGCCGGDCHSKAQPPVSESNVVMPEGLEVNMDVGTNDLREKLSELFEKSKREAEARDKSEKELIITGQTSIDTNDYVDVELPNGMVVKVHKDSHKAKQEDMNRLIEAAGGEMDCSEEDEDGNLISHETELAPDGTDKAQSDYKPGMLRDLKTKFYPNDNSGAKAQARLADRDLSEAYVAARFQAENEKYTKPSTAFQNEEVCFTLNKRANVKTPYKSEGHVWEFFNEWVDDIEKFAEGETVESNSKFVTVVLENDVRVHVPKDFDFNKSMLGGAHTVIDNKEAVKGKLERILKAATVAAHDKAGEARAERTNILHAKVHAERRAAEASRARLAAFTRDIITISPIENPSLLRRAIRTVRRTWKRLVTWWRL